MRVAVAIGMFSKGTRSVGIRTPDKWRGDSWSPCLEDSERKLLIRCIRTDYRVREQLKLLFKEVARQRGMELSCPAL